MQSAECRVMEDFLTLFGNHLIKYFSSAARKVTLTLNSALLTHNFLFHSQKFFQNFWLWNKTIHPIIELHFCALVPFSARGRLTRGTSHWLLNAAWFPTWHGSQRTIAQDPPFNTEKESQTASDPPSKGEWTPAIADFGYRTPLTPRLVWPYFTAKRRKIIFTLLL